MSNFSTNENRDASASIAGFVYQIELTILRWLDLQTGQALDLERGEDIDNLSSRLSSGLSGVITIFERTNEQVKLRKAPITLASEAAREAVANFHKQRTENNEWDLYFRFTTTARPTYEQKNRFPGSTPAILRWEALRRGEITNPTERAHVLSQLRQILVNLSMPRGFNEATWQAWRDFITNPQISTDEALLDFISRFEWGYGTLNLQESHTEVLDKIAARTGWGRPLCVQLYRKLLSHVAMLISQSGEKRLRPEVLQEFISHPVLDTTETSILSNLQLLLVGFEDLKALLRVEPTCISRFLRRRILYIYEWTLTLRVMRQVPMRCSLPTPQKARLPGKHSTKCFWWAGRSKRNGRISVSLYRTHYGAYCRPGAV